VGKNIICEEWTLNYPCKHNVPKNAIITSISNYEEEIAYADIQNFQPVQRTAN
jgi:hypothetical protein